MKSLSEQLREFMDAIESASDTPEQPKKAPSYNYEFTIDNWIEPPEDENAPWEETREVGVAGAVHGRYYPATREEPAEYPELEINHVYDLETGEDVMHLLSDHTMNHIHDLFQQELDAGSDDYDGPDDDYDDNPYYDGM